MTLANTFLQRSLDRLGHPGIKAACVAAFISFGVAATNVMAGPGHDHGDAPAAATGPALPRFTASSELFELVGVLDGKKLTVYLDHAPSNEPVKDAKLDLEIGNQKVTLAAHDVGEFEATLAAELKPGVYPITATVNTAKETDLLAGELDWHGEEKAAEPAARFHWETYAKWAGAAVGALLLLVLAVLAIRRVGARRNNLRMGGAA